MAANFRGKRKWDLTEGVHQGRLTLRPVHSPDTKTDLFRSLDHCHAGHVGAEPQPTGGNPGDICSLLACGSENSSTFIAPGTIAP